MKELNCLVKYLIYTDGLKRVNVVEDNNKNIITSNAVYNGLLGKLTYLPRGANIAITDCDLAPDGLFSKSNMEHAPNNSSGFIYLLTLPYDNNSNYKIQFGTIINSNDLYVRSKIAGTWDSTWRTIS